MKFLKLTQMRGLHYIPGLIILAFGMMALYASVKMIEQRALYETVYKNFGFDLQKLQVQLITLEDVFYDYQHKKSTDNFKTLKIAFEAMVEQYEKTMHIRYDILKDERLQTYRKHLFSLRIDIIHMAEILAKIKKASVDKDDQDTARLFYESNEGLLREVALLQNDFLNIMGNLLSSPESDIISKMLYWSVFAMGFAGFVLVLLNTYRLEDLKIAAREKKQTLALLENRQAAMDASRDGLMIMDSHGKLTYLNKALMSIHGLDAEQYKNYIGQSFHVLFRDDAEHKIKHEITPALMRQGYWRGKFLVHRKDGSDVHTEFSLTKVDDGSMIGSMLDVTEEQRTRDEKSRIEDQFYQAQKMEAIGRLTGGIAHDFNNILAAMNGYAEFLIKDLEKGSAQQKFASNILQAGKQARDLVERMLAFSRRGDSAVQSIDIVQSVRETAVMLEASLPKTIEVICDVRVPAAVIKGNGTQIGQTIMNLCVNAKDAMEDDHGKLTVSVERVSSRGFYLPWVLRPEYPDPQDAAPIRIEEVSAVETRLSLGTLKENTDYILLRVRDTGCGMDRIVMEHIFEPFFTTKSVDKGTGLGLATVHGVITRHQGVLVVQSILNEGTSFDLYFPAVEDGVVSECFDQEGAAQKVEKVDVSRKANILLVEDQDNVRDMMQTLLLRMNCNVKTAVNGLEALDMIRENPAHYDLVITDHNMPRMTGLELAQQIHIDLPSIPFIIFSGYSQNEIEEIQKSHPAIRAVLRKPIARESLEQKIKMVLSEADIYI